MRDRKLIDKLHAAIDKKFEANTYKGTWKNLTNEQIRAFLFLEINELFSSVEDGDHANSILEAADVALFAVFLADPERNVIQFKSKEVVDKSL